MALIVRLIFISVLLITSLYSENYLLNGGQESLIKYRMVQKIEPTSETVTVNLSFVEPQSFSSATYSQLISGFGITTNLPPQKTKQWRDVHGNAITKYTWEKPKKTFEIEVSYMAVNKVNFKPIETSAPFPLKDIPSDITKYLGGSDFIQINDAQIIAKAKELTHGAKTEFDAIQKILTWIVDHMRYVLTPKNYDAVFSYQTGRGNCQNYSHLAAAIMRSSGIPVRVINGVTLKKPYDIIVGNRTMTLNMAEGRHSWIEVYFPDLGWMPFDPQQTELFVSNRFIRVEVGFDNDDTENDGMIHWTRQKGSTKMLSFQEIYDANFAEDNVSISGERQTYGPAKMLLLPPVVAGYSKAEIPVAILPVKYEQDQLMQLKFENEYIFGNLDFPQGINFAFNRTGVDDEAGVSQKLKKTFLVETAEYVTTKNEYCQVFVLENPIQLHKIGLALQKFGGSGEIWVNLHEDQNGHPGLIAAKSGKINMNKMKLQQGYQWIDFDFKSQELILTPDKYWISLGYKGSPIVNWFYSYGKPVGPVDGTRYKLNTDTSWDKSLSYEFNYRIQGLIPGE